MRPTLAVLAVVGLAAVVVTGIALVRARDETRSLPVPERLWLRVPNVGRLDASVAIARVEAEGWKPWTTDARVRGRYLLRGWVGGRQRGVVKAGWGRIACGARLTQRYRLDLGVAKTRADCGRTSAVPPFFAFRTREGWAAIWGFDAVIELWSPSDGYTLLGGELSGGTCGRPAKSRAFHLGPSLDISLLRHSTWHARERQSRTCITHHGGRDFVANHRPAADTTLRRRAFAARIEIAFRYPPTDRFDVTVRPARRGTATLVSVRGPAIGGSSPIGAHIRPGTCKSVSGPEYAFTLEPDGDNSQATGGVVVPVRYGFVVAEPHVIELHGNVNYSDGAAVTACARLNRA
jgi:hypothetical protein